MRKSAGLEVLAVGLPQRPGGPRTGRGPEAGPFWRRRPYRAGRLRSRVGARAPRCGGIGHGGRGCGGGRWTLDCGSRRGWLRGRCLRRRWRDGRCGACGLIVNIRMVHGDLRGSAPHGHCPAFLAAYHDALEGGRAADVGAKELAFLSDRLIFGTCHRASGCVAWRVRFFVPVCAVASRPLRLGGRGSGASRACLATFVQFFDD